MDRIKKLNGSMIAAIVLSVLLIMSITMTATLAWFSSRDSGSRTLVMGEAVVVTISDANDNQSYRQGDGQLAMALPVNEETNGLLPGMKVQPNIKVQLQGSNTNALLRARFITTVEYPDQYVDAAYSDKVKYPDKSGYTANSAGEVLDPAVFPDDHIYAGVINYDYYDYQGRLIEYYLKGDAADHGEVSNDGKYALDKNGARIQKGVYDPAGTNHSVSIQLTRVKVRDEIHAAAHGGPDNNKLTIAGVPNTVITPENAAVMEIRQRGYDLTEAINAVLNGELGKRIDPTTGAIVDGVQKYERRVADGWAYRQSDKAWYYLGSATNGFTLQNQTGTNEEVTTTVAAKDITAYTLETPAAGTSVYVPTYAALTKAGENDEGTAHDDTKYDKSRNYLGTPDGTTGKVTAENNETAVLSQASIASIDLSANGGTEDANEKANVSIDFLVKEFSLPTFIDNNYAKARITFTFTVEAVQDYLIDPTQEALGNAERIPNNLANAILVFNNAFPASRAAGDSALEATGTYYNTNPGQLTHATNLSSFPNKGYASTKDPESGKDILNYDDGTADYKIGYASSLGVQPNGKATITIGGGGEAGG